MQHRTSTMARAAAPATSIALLFALAGCEQSDSTPPPTPGPGVIFTYPHPDQHDVPEGARVAVGLTSPVDPSALDPGCRVEAGRASGAFCVVGPDGPVPGALTVTGDQGTVIHFQPDALQQGTTYEVYVRPAVMRERAINLPAHGPLFSFHTRQDRVRGGERPVVWTVNGEDPAAFRPGSSTSPRFPTADFATLRVLFSEPIAAQSVVPGDSFAFVAVDPAGGEETPVAGTLLVQGIHLVFDPVQDLTPGTTYRVRLTEGVRDLSGEPLVAATFELTPVATQGSGPPIAQVLTARTDQKGMPAVSPMTGGEGNLIRLRSPLIGDSTIQITSSSLQTELADPARAGTRVPLVLRRGQTLALTGLDVALSGQIPLGLRTGDIQVRLISDANGFLTRNPYRDQAQPPHDQEAPVYLYLTLDVAVTSTDQAGNAVLNQTIPNLQAVGVTTAVDGALSIDALAAMELDLLGISKAPANLALRLRTAPDAPVVPDAAAPRLMATYPAPEQDSFPVDKSILLTFSEPLAAEQLAIPEHIALTTAQGAPVELLLDSRGSTLVLTPRQPLPYGTTYALALRGGLRDLAGNAWTPAGTPFADSGQLVFATPLLVDAPTPPLMTMLYPGVPCALTDPGPESPGRCQGGKSNDGGYLPFELPANRNIEIAFDAPMDPATLVLGTDCDTGTVRVEMLDPAGTCAGPVPGALMVRERGLRFVPAAPWTPGQVYRITLVAGSNDDCDPGDICGQNRLPLNTNPLAGTGQDEGGGPPAVIAFTAVPPTDDSLLLSSTVPRTDVNGNGFPDHGEVPRDQNRVAVAITNTGGIIDDARFDQPDCLPDTARVEACSYLSAELPVSIGAARTSCTIGEDEQGAPITVDRCVPVRIYPQILYGTSLTMDADVVGLGAVDDLRTGRLIMRLREARDQPIIGYIIDDPDGTSRFLVDMELYLDAPDLSILGGLASHDLRSKRVSMSLAGPVWFLEDGRIAITLTNTRAAAFRVRVSAAIGGHIDMQIPAGALGLQLAGETAAGSDLRGRLP